MFAARNLRESHRCVLCCWLASRSLPRSRWPLRRTLAPKDIQATFFNGQPFTAATPSNVKFKMVFTADGKMTREPISKSAAPRAKAPGSSTKDGFCTTWKGSKANCYRVAQLPATTNGR